MKCCYETKQHAAPLMATGTPSRNKITKLLEVLCYTSIQQVNKKTLKMEK